ncbi:SMEK domain-containing protein [Mucilaginibacter sp. AW1-3]
MLNETNEINRVNLLLGTWLTTVRLSNAVNYFDINKSSEGLCLGLLNLVYNYKLSDLNDEKINFPGIDLGDKGGSKIAFQVTSRTDVAKIISSLKVAVAKGHHQIFSNGIRFFILNQDRKITFTKTNTPQKILSSFVDSTDLFYPETLIRDIKKLYRTDHNRFLLVKDLLENEVGHSLQQASSAAILNLNLELQLSKKELENEIDNLRKNVVPELELTPGQIKEINKFLEIYNTILEREFKLIKDCLYSDYFKIGVGIIRYEKNNYSFLLFPVPYTSNEPLIKRIKTDTSFDIGKAVITGTVLVLHYSHENTIGDQPFKLAYSTIKDDFERAFKQYQFPIHDDFVVNEYLTSFVDSFHVILGFNSIQNTYDLSEIKFTINKVWPIWLESILNINPALNHIHCNVDDFQNRKDTPEHKKQMELAFQRAKMDDVPVVKVDPTSTIYNIALVNYYIDYLERNDITATTRIYNVGQTKPHIYGTVWSSWNMEIMAKNLKIFFENFARVYNQFLAEYFPLLTKELALFDHGNTLIFLLIKDHSLTHGPQIEYFKLKSVAQKQNSIHFYVSDDLDNPIDKTIFSTGEVWTRPITINGNYYNLRGTGMIDISFINSKLPSYSLIKLMVAEKVKSYLENKI